MIANTTEANGVKKTPTSAIYIQVILYFPLSKYAFQYEEIRMDTDVFQQKAKVIFVHI